MIAESADGKQQLTQPLLADEGAVQAAQQGLTTAVSDCHLQDKCFLSFGSSESSDAYKKVQRKLVIACILCFIFMIIEVIGGYIAKSVAIMSDAAHMLSDVSAFLVSIFAAWAATQPSSWHYSFGYHRAEILGALVSVLTIWAVTGALVFEAVQRTINPVRVDGKIMFIVSVAGVCFNIMVALALGVHAHLGGCSGHDHSHDHDHGHGHTHDHEHDGKTYSGHGHKHDHDHNHSNGHVHQHGGKSCNSSHKHDRSSHDHSNHSSGGHSSHSHLHAAGGSCDHDHERSHSKAHSHHSHSDHSSCSSSADDSSKPLLAEQREAAAATAAWTAPAVEGAPSGGKDCIIINLPASAGASCGLTGHEVTSRCTIARTGSHEIEVRCELPAPSALDAAAGGVGAGKSSSRPATGHAHSHGHDHGHSHEAGSINLRSAVLHVIGDILQSIGVAIAGALIWYNQDDPRWYIADPICTFIFSIVVLLTTKSILRDIVHVLMERTPTNIDIPAMSQVMHDMDGVHDVHDLHIWNISTSTSPVLTAHVHIGPDADASTVLQKLEQYIRGVGIKHSTIQICNPLQPAA